MSTYDFQRSLLIDMAAGHMYGAVFNPSPESAAECARQYRQTMQEIFTLDVERFREELEQQQRDYSAQHAANAAALAHERAIFEARMQAVTP